jgi:UDP-N-acetylglucosamine 2-epimerase (non-hydrolysing)
MKILIVVAARPNFIKAAPLIKAIELHNQNALHPISSILVHTGQHYDYQMSQVFFQDMNIPDPDIHLGIGSGSHAEQTGNTMIKFEQVLLAQKPDIVLVFGDVNATLAASLSAVKLHVPIAHVESGIRTYDFDMPEEVNRRLTDHISDFLFTTSKYDDSNLLKEGIEKTKIHRVGNIMVDSLLMFKATASVSTIVNNLNLNKREFILLTLHRPNNVDDPQKFSTIVNNIIKVTKNIPIVFPVHPRTRKNIKLFNLETLFSNNNIKLIDPVGYLDSLKLEMDSKYIITDSGGIQVESTVFGIPCLTIMDKPVWLITHKEGTNILVKSDGSEIRKAVNSIYNKRRTSKRPSLWDGNTASRIIKILSDIYKSN